MTVEYTVPAAGSGMAALFSSGSADITVSADFKDITSPTDPNTWPLDDQNNLVAPSSLTTLPNNIGSYITDETPGIDLSDTQITIIGKDAFKNCSTLTEIILPKTLTTIDDFAFSRCTSLESITLPNSVGTIGSGAFWGCSSLKSITLPNSVSTIESGAFWDCTSLTLINLKDTGITEILSDTFAGCTSLATVILPSKLTSIGYGAFQECTGLTRLYFTSGEVPKIAENNTSSDNFTVGAFLNADAEDLTIHYPSSWEETNNLEALQDAIEESGMENVNINGNTPKFESYTTLPTLSLLDAARLFGL